MTNYMNENNKTTQYIDKLNELDGNIDLLLSEFQTIYVVSQMNPTDTDIQQQYQNIKNSLEGVMTQLFTVSTNIQNDINDLNDELFVLDKDIIEERKKNRELKQKLGHTENTKSASDELISDYKNIYNTNYLRNWSLVVSAVICLGVIRNTFK